MTLILLTKPGDEITYNSTWLGRVPPRWSAGSCQPRADPTSAGWRRLIPLFSLLYEARGVKWPKADGIFRRDRAEFWHTTGLFTRDFESFGGILRGPVVNVGVTFGPQTLSLEPENVAVESERRESPYWLRDTTKPRKLSLSGFSVNYMGADIPLYLFGSPNVTLFVTIASASPGTDQALKWGGLNHSLI